MHKSDFIYKYLSATERLNTYVENKMLIRVERFYLELQILHNINAPTVGKKIKLSLSNLTAVSRIRFVI